MLRTSATLPETVVSVALAATVVGAAATLLIKRTKESEKRYVLYFWYFRNAQYSMT